MESEDRTSYVRHWERKANEESYKSKLNKTNHIKMASWDTFPIIFIRITIAG